MFNIIPKVLELLTIKAGLLKTMLTVFKHNTNAVTFFKEVKQCSAATGLQIQLQLQIQAAIECIIFTMLALQGLKYNVDETSPLDTIQVSNSCKQSSFTS